MLSSHKTASYRSLHSSTALIVSRSCRTDLRTRGAPTICRNFSWGSKHKLGSNRAGKVWKGFSTRDAAGKDAARKQIYGGTFYNYHYPGTLRRHLQRYPGVQEWRSASSWGKYASNPTKVDQSSDTNNKPEEKGSDDWYTRWAKRENRYNDLVRRIEEDPFGALFGKKWVNWIDDAVQKDIRGAGTPTTNSEEKSNVPMGEKIVWDWACDTPTSSSKVAGSKHASAQQPTKQTVIVESQVQEYEFDPISMRKVPKRSPSPLSKIEIQGQVAQKSFDIPVKHWKGCVSYPRATNEPATANQKGGLNPPTIQVDKSWLTQEGFGSRREQRADPRRAMKTTYVESNPRTSKIESALDRHLQSNDTQQSQPQQPALEYKPKENTTEDIDLLRSSDVRASAGLRGKVAKETNAEKQERQQNLEQQFDARPLDREDRLARELGSALPTQVCDSIISEIATSTSVPLLKDTRRIEAPNVESASWVNEISDIEPAVSDPNKSTGISKTVMSASAAAIYRSNSSADKVGKLKDQILPLKARLDAMKADYDTLRQRWLIERRRQEQAKKMDDMHDAEVNSQKIAMAAMEARGTEQSRKPDAPMVKHDQGDKKTPRQQLQSFLPGEGDLSSNVHEFAKTDRWYKRKAPHARDELDAKYQQIAKDRALVQEIRGIYEESYGTIDTRHRQSSRPEVTPENDVVPETHSATSTNPSPSSGVTEPDQPALPTHKLDTGDTSDPLAIVQKLFSELRQAQTILHEHRGRLTTDSAKPRSDAERSREIAFQTQEIYKPVVMQIAKQALKLGKMSGLSGVIAAAAEVADTTQSSNARYSSKVATHEASNKAPPFVYRILAYDSATEKITSAKATSLAPFSKEQQLLPVEALEVLNNPGKFLPHLMTLHEKGYSVVSGTSNILVFKKEATGDELAAAKHAEAVRHPNPIDGTVAQTGNFASPTGFVNHDSPIPLDELEARAEEQATEDQASDCKPVTNGKVRREEDVFSGSHRGNWQEAGRKHQWVRGKHGRRQKGMFGRMLLTGTITAACCYTIGLASEMLR